MVKEAKKAEEAEVVFQEPAAPEGFDLAEQHPRWKFENGSAIRGLALGTMDLPSTVDGQDYWRVIVVRLTAPCLAHVINANGEEEKAPSVVETGTLVLVTMTASLKRLVMAINSPVFMHELYLKPGPEKKTSKGFMVETFLSMVLGEPKRRKADDFLPRSPNALVPALGTSSANAEADIPF